MSVLDRLRKQPKPPEREDPKPRGGSGRGHAFGFLELEEHNPDLRHPQSHTTYDRMHRGDADIKQVLSLVINPMLAGTWGVEPYGGQEAEEKDIEVAAATRWALFEHMSPNLIGHLAEFLPVVFRSGFAPGEVLWGVAEHDGKKLIAPRCVEMRLPRSVWRWHQKHGRLVAIDQYLPAGSPSGVGSSGQSFEYDPQTGSGANFGLGSVRLDARNLIYYRVGAEGDNWEGVSCLRPAYKHWFIKDTIERIDAIAQEREALGVPVLYAPPGATPAQLDDMETVLKNFRAAEQGYIIMPGMKAGVSGTPDGSGWLLELIGFDRTGSGRDPQPSLEYHSSKIAAAFIAEFMRQSEGARAAAEVQADPFLMAVEAIVTTCVETALNESLVKPFVAYNFADVENPPKLKMSLVDATSLSQLADFVLKLTQVGALLPDQELEDFLRARADMPPANPKSVADRADDEEMIRRMIVGGNVNPTPADEMAAEQAEAQAEADRAAGIETAKVKGGAGPSNTKDAFGSNAKVGKHKNNKPAGGGKKSGAPKGRGGAGQGSPRGAAKNLDDGGLADDDMTGFHAVSRWWELHVDLDGLDQLLGEVPVMLQTFVGSNMHALAAEMAGDDTPMGEASAGSGARKGMRDELHACLMHAYDTGGDHVHDELAAQGYTAAARSLDRGARDRGGAHLAGRAGLAAEAVELSMRQAMVGHDLAHGSVGRAQAAAERAGMAALRRAGHDHAVAAVLHGRHDTATQLADAGARLSVRYSSILDGGRCDHCADADDGVPRGLDDPVRLEHQPPNQYCESLDSGHNRCRCFEVYELDDTELTTLSDDGIAVGELPGYLRRIITLLIARGMPADRALTVSVRVARQVADDGKVRWPGLRQVGAGDRDGARDAVAWVESQAS